MRGPTTMIRTKLFQKHYATLAGIVLIFIFLGLNITRGLMHLSNEQREFRPPLLFARMINELDPADHIRGLRRFEELSQGDSRMEFEAVGADGRVLFPEGATFPFHWSELKLPSGEFQALQLEKRSSEPGPPPASLMRLPGEPAVFLYVAHKNTGSRGWPGGSVGFSIMTFGSMILFVLLGIGIALTLIFRNLRSRTDAVDSVIHELKSGNLKARLPITSGDEMGQAMLRFNQMADEIERLVERMRSSERSRMTLLQELAHDLRTPVASLNNLLATLEKKNNSPEPELRLELISLAQKEAEYFGRLVEDLLVLAQVSEPNYLAERKPLEIGELIEDEAEGVSSQYEAQGRAIRLRSSFLSERALVHGDLHLLRRLLRNALENAFSFAKSEVSVGLQAYGSAEIRITVEDDGPGMSQEVLRTFGERKPGRAVGTKNGGRLSVGLGAVIMKTVAELHRGHVVAENRLDSEGRILGARVTIVLPNVAASISRAVG